MSNQPTDSVASSRLQNKPQLTTRQSSFNLLSNPLARSIRYSTPQRKRLLIGALIPRQVTASSTSQLSSPQLSSASDDTTMDPAQLQQQHEQMSQQLRELQQQLQVVTQQLTQQQSTRAVSPEVSLLASKIDRLLDSPASGSSSSNVLTQFLKHVKVSPYSSRKATGKFLVWIRDVETLLLAHNLDPASSDRNVQAQMRTCLKALLRDDAARAVDTWETAATAAGDSQHPVYTYKGLKDLLANRYVAWEDQVNAQWQLFEVQQGRMSARDYSDKFEQLLTDAGWTENKEMLSLYIRGLRPALQETLLTHHVEVTSLAKAIELACKACPLSKGITSVGSQLGPTPMDINSLQGSQVEQQIAGLTAQLAALRSDFNRRGDGQSPRPRLSDPRQHRLWPRHVQRDDDQMDKCMRERLCYLCNSPGHTWLGCHQLRGRNATPDRDRRSPGRDYRSPERNYRSPDRDRRQTYHSSNRERFDRSVSPKLTSPRGAGGS